MNYYKFHVGDYASATAHLRPLQDCFYRRALDRAYQTEKPLPADFALLCRVLRAVSKHDKRALLSVMTEFFHPGPNGWSHSRVESEIRNLNLRCEEASRAAKILWKQRRDGTNRNASAQRPHSGTDATHYPLPTTKEKDAASAASTDPRKRLFDTGVALLIKHGSSEQAARSFLAIHAKANEPKLAELIAYLATHPKLDPRSYIAAAMKRPSGEPGTYSAAELAS